MFNKIQTAEPKTLERRDCDRLEPDGRAYVTLRQGLQTYDCEIANISLSGIGLRLPAAQPAPDGPVELEHETAGRLSGHAVWQENGLLGIELAAPRTELERALQCINMIILADERVPME